MNAHEEATVLALVEILNEHVEEIAAMIAQWGTGSTEVDQLLHECLKAAEIDAA